jgi:hypothetical protein
MKKGVRLSSGTDDSAGINIAQVIANVNTKYSAVMRRVNRDWYVLASAIPLHSSVCAYVPCGQQVGRTSDQC